MKSAEKIKIPSAFLKYITNPEECLLYTKKFEEKLAKFLQAKYALATNSCTSAIQLALECLDIKKGDEIIVPPLSWPATWHPAAFLGSTLIPIDLSRDFPVMDIIPIKKSINLKTKAIIAVGLWGYSAGISEIYRLAKEKEIPLILDAAQMFNATVKHCGIGTLGDFVVLSFSNTKGIMGLGEGGAVLCDDLKQRDRLLMLSQHPVRNYMDVEDIEILKFNESFNHNFRIHPLAALLGLQLLVQYSSVKSQQDLKNRAKKIKHILKKHSALEVMPPSEWTYSKSNGTSILINSNSLPDKQIKNLCEELKKQNAMIKRCPYRIISELHFAEEKKVFSWQKRRLSIKLKRYPNAEYWKNNLLIVSL